jgi:hypothetical protein
MFLLVVVAVRFDRVALCPYPCLPLPLIQPHTLLFRWMPDIFALLPLHLLTIY